MEDASPAVRQCHLAFSCNALPSIATKSQVALSHASICGFSSLIAHSVFNITYLMSSQADTKGVIEPIDWYIRTYTLCLSETTNDHSSSSSPSTPSFYRTCIYILPSPDPSQVHICPLEPRKDGLTITSPIFMKLPASLIDVNLGCSTTPNPQPSSCIRQNILLPQYNVC